MNPLVTLGASELRALAAAASDGRLNPGGDESAAVRDGRSEPASAEGPGERNAVAGVQLVGEGFDGGVLRGGVRPVRGVLPSAAVRTPRQLRRQFIPSLSLAVL